jgi:hypothetical protein
MRTNSLALASGLIYFAFAPAALSSTLSTNGPINGTITGWQINGGEAVTNSFAMSSNAAVTGVSGIGLWANSPGNVPLTLDWVVSTAANGGGTVEGSGSNVSLSVSYIRQTGFAGIYSAGFSIGNLFLTAGTYYLELLNATDTQPSFGIFWDQNNGPSSAYQTYLGNPLANPSGSESFEIDGITVLEPATRGYIACGLLFLSIFALTRGYRQSTRKFIRSS